MGTRYLRSPSYESVGIPGPQLGRGRVYPLCHCGTIESWTVTVSPGAASGDTFYSPRTLGTETPGVYWFREQVACPAASPLFRMVTS